MNEYVPFIIMMAFAVMAAIVFIIFAWVMYLLVARPWVRAAASGAPVSFYSVLGMRLRGSPPLLIVEAYIALKRAGVNVSIADVEIAYIAQKTRVRSRDDLIELVKAAAANHEAERSS